MSVLRVTMCMDYLISQIEMFDKGKILLMNRLSNFPHNCGQSHHNLIIPKPDRLQSHLTQYLLPPFIFLFLQIVDISIHFNNQRGFMAVKINDKSLNDLLPPKTDSQFIRP
jgi:hypothetical protein